MTPSSDSERERRTLSCSSGGNIPRTRSTVFTAELLCEDQVARLGGFQGGGEGFLVADLPDENHIGVFPQGGT